MNSKKVFLVMIAAVAIMGSLLIATVIYGEQLLKKQSTKLVSLRLDDQVIESQSKALVQAKKDIEKYSELEAIAKQIVPQDKDQARATREIVSLAAQAGVSIASISFPTSSLGQAPAKTAATETTEKASTATTTPATSTVSQVKPVTGITGLYQLDITVVSDNASPATYAKLIDFLSKLEQNRRTAQVSQITIQPDAINRTGLNFTLTITVYIKP